MVSFTTTLSAVLGAVTLATQSASAATCTDVHVVFARGTNQPAGLGAEGIPLVAGITSGLPTKTVSSYAVDYAANQLQTSAGPGATDMTRHIVSYAASCPNAVFVIGGYSQGATVTDIAIGINTILGKGEVIPTSLAPRIKAVVTFGNPIAILGQSIVKNSPLYAAKSIDYCNKGDPICANGSDGNAHLAYPTNGMVTEAAARAVKLVKGSARNLRAD